MNTKGEKLTNRGNQQERLTREKELRLNPNYIVGLVDGEGYFSVSTRKRKRRKSTSNVVEMKFGIEIKETDKEILVRIAKTLGFGKLYFKKEKRINFCHMWVYLVNNNETAINKVIPFFKKHQLKTPSRVRTFTVYCEIANIVSEKGHLTEEGFTRVTELARSMHA